MDQEDHNHRITLQTLPVELQWKIFEFLDYPSALSLSATCRSLYFSPRRPLSFQSIADKNAFLVTAENFEQHWICNKSYACFHCSTMKPRAHFSKSQTSGLYNRYRPRGTSRFCLDCGVASGYYPPGHKVRTRGGDLLHKCGTCPVLTSGRFCDSCRMCHDCLVAQYGPRSDLCSNPSCMSLENQEHRKVMDLKLVFEEDLPSFTVDEALDDAFTRPRSPRIEPLYYDWFAQWCHGPHS